jgi:hypothetical protein
MNDAFANGDETLGPSSMNSIMAANVPVVRGAPVFGDSGSYLVPNLYFNFGSIPGASTVLGRVLINAQMSGLEGGVFPSSASRADRLLRPVAEGLGATTSRARLSFV